MQTSLYQYQNGALTRHSSGDEFNEANATLVLCFAAKSLLADSILYDTLRARHPAAHIIMSSTAGEILGTQVVDDTASITVIKLNNTPLNAHAVNIADFTGSYAAGAALRDLFPAEGLRYLFVLSDGSKVNGSELVRGLNHANTPLLITGGLAGDGAAFHSTLVGLNSAAEEGVIAGIGFYGDAIHISHGSLGGWEVFGLEKTVTRSRDNVLYEIEGKPALDLYRKYLGPEADGLPGTALLFPLSVIVPGSDAPVVRTILSIDDSEGSMTFAGDIPEGAQVRFMRANFDKLTAAASGAASQSLYSGPHMPALAVLVSCIGRKLILDRRTEEEVEAVNDVFGGHTMLTGFYSYGEISPLVPGGECLLHNQTMTITTFYETE